MWQFWVFVLLRGTTLKHGISRNHCWETSAFRRKFHTRNSQTLENSAFRGTSRKTWTFQAPPFEAPNAIKSGILRDFSWKETKLLHYTWRTLPHVYIYIYIYILCKALQSVLYTTLSYSRESQLLSFLRVGSLARMLATFWPRWSFVWFLWSSAESPKVSADNVYRAYTKKTSDPQKDSSVTVAFSWPWQPIRP